LGNASYQKIALLFAMGVTFHNLEEALFLARWMRSHVRLWSVPNPTFIWILTSLISLVIWVAAIGVNVRPENRSFQLALAGFALAMAINAVFPHLTLSLVKRSYSPGAATGMLFNLPLGTLILWKSASSGEISGMELWSCSAIYAVVLGIVAFGGLFTAHFLLERSTRKSPVRKS
jgi:Na+(H+)/acetate symporter ActP